jgi:hypothetical protein
MHPKYRVCWTQVETCKTCGSKHTGQFTYAYSTPENALEQAARVLQSPDRTLIYVEL